MDTPTTIMSSWDAPNSVYDKENMASDTSVGLSIPSVQTVDGGDYICSASVTDSSNSVYIIDSDPATDTINIIVRTYHYYRVLFLKSVCYLNSHWTNFVVYNVGTYSMYVQSSVSIMYDIQTQTGSYNCVLLFFQN